MLEGIEKLLIEGNFRFQSKIIQNSEKYPFEQKIPKYPILFLTCMDPRIDVNQIFQFNSGDVFILRNAGNAYTLDMMRSILIAIYKFNIKYIIILGHTDCSMTKINLKEIRDKLPNEFLRRLTINYSVLLTKLNDFFRPFDNEISNIIKQMNSIQEIKAYFPDVEIAGMLYDSQTGWIFKQEDFRDLLSKDNQFRNYKELLFKKSQELTDFLKVNNIYNKNQDLKELDDKGGLDNSKLKEEVESQELDTYIEKDDIERSNENEDISYQLKIPKFQVPKIYIPKINMYTPKVKKTVNNIKKN
ncbi:MAG: carbonic anhydrase [Promethearchaeota archaeon]